VLIYFKTSNQLSFDEEITFSTIAGKYKTKNHVTGEKTDELEDNLLSVDRYNIDLIRTSVIYGANASGKSNLILSVFNAVNFITENFKEAKSFDFVSSTYTNFVNRNNELNLQKPIKVIFGILIDNSIQFEYSFSYNSERIVEEILTEYRTQKPIEHFWRSYNDFEQKYNWRFSKYFKGPKEVVKNITNEFALYLTVGASSKLIICEKVFKWFNENLIFSIDAQSPGIIDDESTLKDMHENPSMKKFILDQLKIADFNITDIHIEMDGEEIKTVSTYHNALNKNGDITPVQFNYFGDESVGTRRFIGWLGYLMYLISTNKILFIDEFGASMHSLLTKHLIQIINTRWENGLFNYAQLIFTTHDTNLMTRELFRPDQIWISERDEFGNSKLYSLSQFKLLKGQSLESNYLQGLYGGIPHFNNMNNE
jgi:AAA15 family ATPase/GTPase